MIPGTREIAIRDLAPNTWLEFDLLTPRGETILKKGQWLAESMVQRWLAEGFVKVLAQHSTGQLIQPLDQAVIRETTVCTQETVERLGQLVTIIATGIPSKLDILAPVLSMIGNLNLSDRDAAMWTIETDHQAAEAADHRLAKRSAKFGLISFATARAFGLGPEECNSVAMAALLHDIALYTPSMEYIQRMHRSGFGMKQILRQHSLLGAELASMIDGVTRVTLQTIMEVHEQIDGTGYPRGLRENKLSMAGKILNVVDAYLNLTDAAQPDALIPADAIAYLIKHTSRGAFEMQCTRAFLKVTSAYGIGTRVTLDDDSYGDVVRSSETDALRPIIRLDTGQGEVIDLRHSALAIREAVRNPADTRQRIRRSEMERALWAPAYLAD